MVITITPKSSQGIAGCGIIEINDPIIEGLIKALITDKETREKEFVKEREFYSTQIENLKNLLRHTSTKLQLKTKECQARTEALDLVSQDLNILRKEKSEKDAAYNKLIDVVTELQQHVQELESSKDIVYVKKVSRRNKQLETALNELYGSIQARSDHDSELANALGKIIKG